MTGTLNGGPSVALLANGTLTIAAGGTVTATAIGLTAAAAGHAVEVLPPKHALANPVAVLAGVSCASATSAGRQAAVAGRRFGQSERPGSSDFLRSRRVMRRGQVGDRIAPGLAELGARLLVLLELEGVHAEDEPGDAQQSC